MTVPDLYRFEHELYAKGIDLIAGVDEAGRGPLAGPVVAAAVILKKGARLKHVRDSKQLSEKQRQLALTEIKHHALAIGIALSSVEEIDTINIYRASRQAMISAIDQLGIRPEHVLIDAMPLHLDMPHQSIIKGDAQSISIAAASIIAKTTRDAYMKEMDRLFPAYGFAQNKGYPTEAHLQALRTHGITPIHRQSFKPVKALMTKASS
ncbi:MAG: ribonuclease HII [Acholeplasmataceae bacterium]|nr:MAG: ribonuclease HII [Acholeplasmataceae bacterium]